MRPRRARFLAHPHRPLRWAHEGMRGTHGLAWDLQVQGAGQGVCGWRMAGSAKEHGRSRFVSCTIDGAAQWCDRMMTVERHTMAKAQENVTWVEIDPTTLEAKLNAAYETYKEAQRKAAELRSAFEEQMNKAAELPEGKKLVFGYRFGKLSAAIVDDDRKPKAASPAKLSLSQFIAQQAAQGRRT